MIDLTGLQTRLLERLERLAPGVRAASLADAGHTARPYGVAILFPGGARAFVQLVRIPGPPAAPARDQPPPAAPYLPVFPPDGKQVHTADLEALLAAAAREADPDTVVRLDRHSQRTARPNHPAPGYGVTVGYRDGSRALLLPLMLVPAGVVPSGRMEFHTPARF